DPGDDQIAALQRLAVAVVAGWQRALEQALQPKWWGSLPAGGRFDPPPPARAEGAHPARPLRRRRDRLSGTPIEGGIQRLGHHPSPVIRNLSLPFAFVKPPYALDGCGSRPTRGSREPWAS